MPTLHKLQSAFAERDFDPTSIMHDQENLRSQTFKEGGYTQEIFGFLAEPLSHHANFLSLSTIRTYGTLAQHRWITVVDGVIPLVDFFVRFARPGNSLKTVLLIPLALKKWVPRIWAENVMYYTVKINNDKKTIKKKFFIGIADTGLNSPSELTEEFQRYVNNTPSDVPVVVILHAPNQVIIPHEKEKPFEHVRHLLKVMRDIDHFDHANNIFNNDDEYKNYNFHFSSKIKMIRYHSELEQKLLSKGFSTDEYDQVEISSNLTLKISAFHELLLQDLNANDSDELWDRINFDVSRLGVVDNIVGQDLSKVLIQT